MAKEKFKYSINHQISLLPRVIGIGHIIEILEKEHDINRATFYRDRNVLLTDDYSIPIERLEVYAGLFGLSIDELKNYDPKKIKPLLERNLSSSMVNIIKRTNLKMP